MFNLFVSSNKDSMSEDAAVKTHYNLNEILCNLKGHLKLKNDEDFRIYLLKGMLLILFFRYLFACRVVPKEEENLLMIYLLFTVLLANTIFYIENSREI